MEMPPLFSNGVVPQSTTSQLVSLEADLSLNTLLSSQQQQQQQSHPGSSSLDTPAHSHKKRPLMTNNEILSSLSSSLCLKRKALPSSDSESESSSSNSSSEENNEAKPTNILGSPDVLRPRAKVSEKGEKKSVASGEQKEGIPSRT
ncbi:Hypothetical protein FKW44_021733 [Caligus rogercresseyi]|uniref:Uncharacterized protein n=1 Tax=Caligus rogercresseyi TaxID=217165 RepID=A0A7T8GS74_CALRO|nr:Hypothetical protein FKW44_021733 [Caligus rogercresseyi]